MSISQEEIQRQYRVLRQTLEMHRILHERFKRKADISQMILFLCSVVFCATAFAGDNFYKFLNLCPEVSQNFLKFFSIMAFAFSIMIMIFDWRGKASLHDNSANRWSIALEKFRNTMKPDGTWPNEYLMELSNAYWEADRNSSKIPSNKFNALKAKYLRKVNISKMKSEYPHCPLFVLNIILHFRDMKKVLQYTKEKKNEK